MAAAATLAEIMEQAYKDEGLTYEDVISSKGFISTGNLALDYILGGGIACGRSTELYGLSQSGKTSVAAQCAAYCQRVLKKPVLYVDFEQALDKPYLRALGVDTEDRRLFLPLPSSSLEYGMSTASKAIRTGQLGLVVFDSVPAMTPQKLIETDGESRTTAMERARLLTNELQKLNPILARTATAAIFINHERDVIETGPTRPGMPKRTTTPGGSALKFYSSQRVRFQIVKTVKGERIDPLTGEKIQEGHSVISKATVTKNKLAPPNQVAELYLVLGQGFSNPHAAMGVLVGNGVVQKKTAGIYVFPESLYHPQMKTKDGVNTLQGLGTVLEIAEFDKEWAEKLAVAAQEILRPTAADPTASRKLAEDPEEGGAPPEEGANDEDLDEVLVTTADIVPARPVASAAPPVVKQPVGFGPPPGGSAWRLT